MPASGVSKYGSTLPPEAISDELRPAIEALGLEENCHQLAEEGWTVVENVADPEVNERLRGAILASDLNEHGFSEMVLHTDPAFAEALLNPKILALAEFTVGAGFLVHAVFGTVKPQGGPGIGLHADQQQFPEPYPEHPQLVTACWSTDGYSEAGGATQVVPGSNRRRRMPTPEEIEAREGLVTIECPPNSAVFWSGAVWHGAADRTLPGERVVATFSYSRLAVRPTHDFSPWADELIEKYGTVMSQLLGREDHLCTSTSVDFALIAETFEKVKR